MIGGEKRTLFQRLKETFPQIPTEENFSFARHTTIGCGGAGVACSPEREEDVLGLLSFLEREHIPYCFLGAGANVLPPDGAYGGVVIRFCRLNRLTRCGSEITAGAGATGGALLKFARGNLLGGLEPFTGIPMSVGGATVMNAGVPARHFADVVREVTAVVDGEISRFSNTDCRFSTKSSLFSQGYAVLSVKLVATPSTEGNILRETCYYRNRRLHLPKGRSMGCVFVNPEGDSAGRLVDACGLKGTRMGGAVVSSEHGNFILNEGGSSEDVARLIDFVKAEVLRKSGVSLREEIRRIPPTGERN